MPSTQKTEQQEATRPHVPTPEEFYCLVMQPIEPDLLLSTEEREQKYAGETLEKKKQRMQRYEQAFRTYKEQRTLKHAQLKTDVDAYVRSLRASAEFVSEQEDAHVLHDIEIQFSLLDQ